MKNVNMINSKIKNIFLYSGELYINNALHITSFFLFIMLMQMICNLIGSSTVNPMSLQSLIFNFSSQLFIFGLYLGFYKEIFLLLNQNSSTTIKILFSSFHLIFTYFVSIILFGIIIFLVMLPGIAILSISSDINSLLALIINNMGLFNNNINLNLFNSSDFLIYNKTLFIFGVILIIINVIWAILRLQFYQYIIVDKECSAIEALKNSYDITEGNLYLLLPFTFFIAIINLIGLLLFGIGLFITIPFSIICMIKLYSSIKGSI